MQREEIKQCVEYFQVQSILKKMLNGFVEKYRSFGCVVGRVTLTNLTEVDIETLEGVFGKNYHGKKSASISALSLQNVLDQSKFEGIQIEELLRFMTRDNLQSKKDASVEEMRKQKIYFEEVTEQYQNTFVKEWLEDARKQKRSIWNILLQGYRRNEQDFKETLGNVNQALLALPVFLNNFEYLPIFASKITGDPHYFDEGKEALTLLKNGIRYYLKEEKEKELLWKVGIVKDNISNYVLTYGVQGIQGNLRHRGMEGFLAEREPLQLSLLTISKMEQFTCYNKQLYVVENPIVFAKLAEEAADRCGVVCVNGQPNLAVYTLLDKLAKNGTNMLYAGDFDPEGLLIAQRLKTRYQERLEFWHYDLFAYEKTMSAKQISEKRLKMLEKLTNTSLIEIAKRMKTEKRAAYQEVLMQQYLEKF